MWCIPPKQNAEFVANMEDILSVYARKYKSAYPVICMDEKPFQLVGERYEPIPMNNTNHKLKYDCEYERNGTCSIFMFTEPLAGWRYATALPHRTKLDWANRVKWLVEEQYPKAKKVVLVMDNLNTHKISSLYDAFEPKIAFRIAQKLEIHYTPKHGSWLNIAELELSALTIQCLADRRIPTIDNLNNDLLEWYTNRNASQKGVDWHFSTKSARTKLKYLYPVVKF